jgi:hypothetical protein
MLCCPPVLYSCSARSTHAFTVQRTNSNHARPFYDKLLLAQSRVQSCRSTVQFNFSRPCLVPPNWWRLIFCWTL